MTDPFAFLRYGRWQDVLLWILLFILGMGTFLPFFLLFWLSLAKVETSKPSDFEQEQVKVIPYDGPIASTASQEVAGYKICESCNV